MAISREKLRELEELLYERAVAGDNRVALELLKMHREVVTSEQIENPIVILPAIDMGGDEDEVL